MRLAEHLAVLYRGFAAFTPGGHVVGIHFSQFPLLDFALGTVAYVDKQPVVENTLPLLGLKACEVLLHPELVLDGKLLGDETSDAGNALLSVEDIVAARLRLVEIDEADGVILQDALDDGYLLLAVVLEVEVVALVFWLDGQLARPPEEALALQLVIDKAFAYLPDGQVGH